MTHLTPEQLARRLWLLDWMRRQEAKQGKTAQPGVNAQSAQAS